MLKFVINAIKWLGGTALAGAGVDQVDDKYFDGAGKRRVVNMARSALSDDSDTDTNVDAQTTPGTTPVTTPLNPNASMANAWDQLKQGNLSDALDETASVLSNDFNTGKSAPPSSETTQEQEEKKETNLTGDLLKWLGIGGATVGGGFVLTKALGAMFNNSGNDDDSNGMGMMTKLLMVGVVVGIIANWKTIDNTLGLSDKFNSLTGGDKDNVATQNNGVDFMNNDAATYEM